MAGRDDRECVRLGVAQMSRAVRRLLSLSPAFGTEAPAFRQGVSVVSRVVW